MQSHTPSELWGAIPAGLTQVYGHEQEGTFLGSVTKITLPNTTKQVSENFVVQSIMQTTVRSSQFVMSQVMCVESRYVHSVLLSPPQIPAGLKGFLGIPEDYTII